MVQILSVLLTAYFWLFLGSVVGVAVYATAATAVRSTRVPEALFLVKDWLIVPVVIGVISGVGLPVSILSSRGAASDWMLELGPVSLGGSLASLAFFIIFGISCWTMNRLRRGRINRQYSVWDRRVRTLGRAIGRVLPFAVLLVWAGF